MREVDEVGGAGKQEGVRQEPSGWVASEITTTTVNE